jgi:hypothetical protein
MASELLGGFQGKAYSKRRKFDRMLKEIDGPWIIAKC